MCTPLKRGGRDSKHRDLLEESGLKSKLTLHSFWDSSRLFFFLLNSLKTFLTFFFLTFQRIAFSIAWWIQILIYVVWPGGPLNPFLNNMLTAMNNAFPFSAIVTYGILSFYLLWVSMKGLFRFGFRVPCLFAIHPIK